MRTIRIGALLLFAALVATGAFVSARAPAASAQSGGTVIRVTGPTTAVKKGQLRVPFDVNVDNVTNLGSFTFDLTYDASVFQLVDADHDAEKGDFLGSSGRPVVCNPPIIDAGAGVTRFTCVTLGATPKGADGSGKLATIYLQATGAGSTDITLNRAKLYEVGDASAAPTDPNALPPITFTTQNTTISVSGSNGGMNWLIWGPIIGVAIVVVAGGAFGALRMRRSGAGDAAPAA